MAKIGIVTDSTAYLEPKYIEANDIKVVPLKVIFDDESFREGVDISNDEFFERLKEPGVFPTTSQPSSGEFLEAYQGMAGRYDALLSIHIAAGISGTVDSARTAAAEMGDYSIEIIDSRFTSIQLLMIIEELVKARDQGKDLDELKSLADKLIEESELMFLVDTLEYLRRGGRIGGAQAFLGSMLRIKPILYIDGTIDAVEKVRGSHKALDRLVELSAEKLGGKKVKVGFTHVRDPERMQELLEKAKAALNCDPDAIVYNETGPVIGAHTGPGTVGLGFFPIE